MAFASRWQATNQMVKMARTAIAAPAISRFLLVSTQGHNLRKNNVVVSCACIKNFQSFRWPPKTQAEIFALWLPKVGRASSRAGSSVASPHHNDSPLRNFEL